MRLRHAQPKTDQAKWAVMNEILARINVEVDVGISKTQARKDMEKFDISYLRKVLHELGGDPPAAEPTLGERLGSWLRGTTAAVSLVPRRT